MNREQQIKDAIEKAGGYAEVGRLLGGESRAAVWAWANLNRVPAEKVVKLEGIIGLPRHVIRPDVFPVPETQPEAAA
jgi:YdaS antitoxin of YdaST toxin-antitoxin system